MTPVRAFFVIALLHGATLALAHQATPVRRELAVLVEAPPAVDFAAWRREVAESGVALRHAFPPAGGIVLVAPDDLDRTLAALPAGSIAHLAPVPAAGEELSATLAGRMLWHGFRALAGEEVLAEGGPGLDLVNDALVPPPPGDFLQVCPPSVLPLSTSDYMLGAVTVNVVLPESNGAIDPSTENWTAGEETSVSNEIVEGLNDLSTYYSASFSLHPALVPSWVYHYYPGRTDVRARTSYEPINRTSSQADESLWVSEIYDNLGYGAEPDMFAKGRRFAGDLRTLDGTDWAFTVFVADSSLDADGMFSGGGFAWGYVSGPHLVMTYDNDNWGIGQMNVVTRHETSHVFNAFDEYASSPCTCTEANGYINYQNQNCNKTCLINVNCIMNEWNRQVGVCSYTGGQIGWGDADADAIPDPVDIAPETALNAYAPDPTTNTVLVYTGLATIQALTNQNLYGWRCDRNILPVAAVAWRVDGGAWLPASAVDGSFDSGSEQFTFTTGTLSVGTHIIDAMTVDQVGQLDPTPSSDTVTVTAPAGVTVVPTSGLVTTEAGGGAGFTIVLNSAPAAPAAISLSSSDTTEGTVAPPSVVFDGANWNAPQPVLVAGVDDAMVDGDVPYTIVTGAVVSADPAYSGMSVADVGVTNQDDDTAVLAGCGLNADMQGAASNTVLEPNEVASVEPFWDNSGTGGIAVTGGATGLTGPPGPSYQITDSAAAYGVVLPGTPAGCWSATGDCYAVQIVAASRPTLHWDVQLSESVTGGSAKAWTLHVGSSFADVPTSDAFYRFVETLLHTGVTLGCTATDYCPTPGVPRGQMAAFIARAQTGSDAAVPVSGTVPGRGPYNCVAGGTSVFADVAADHAFCRHVHYIAALGVTLGCTGTDYCPDNVVPRDQMAAFIARAISGGDAGVPMAYSDPQTLRSYDCALATGTHFADVPWTHAFCRHSHYLWARGVVDGCYAAPPQYCPTSAVLRIQMAKFLTNGFALRLYGP